jgi:hypothetical protein
VLTGFAAIHGVPAADQQAVDADAWSSIAAALSDLDGDVIIDAGRLAPRPAGGVAQLLAITDVLVLLCRPQLGPIHHLRSLVAAITTHVPPGRLVIVPAGAAGFTTAEISEALGVRVATAMPLDEKGARSLVERPAGWQTGKSTLAKWAASTAASLAAADPPLEPTPTDSSPTPPASLTAAEVA